MIRSGGLRPEQGVEQVVSVSVHMVGASGEQRLLRGGPFTPPPAPAHLPAALETETSSLALFPVPSACSIGVWVGWPGSLGLQNAIVHRWQGVRLVPPSHSHCWAKCTAPGASAGAAGAVTLALPTLAQSAEALGSHGRAFISVAGGARAGVGL